MRLICRVWVCGALLVVCGASAWGQGEPAAYKPPEDIAFRKATIISEGTRMAAELFSLKSQDGKKLPTIIMCHGWGGTADRLRPDALVFARAGYLVVVFDYRGWGASEARVLLVKPAPADKDKGRFTAEVMEVREVVDPLDQSTDLLNAIHWVHGEPQCDTAHIGLWGSSYAGGHVVYAAARDHRVKALVSQVPGLDSRFVVQTPEDRKKTFSEATQRARGEIGYPPPKAKVQGTLIGAPIRERLMNYAPVEDADKAPGCAMLFILAESEEYGGNPAAIKAHERAKGPKKLVTIPNITHYGVYREAREQCQKLAVEWFDTHLKGAGQPEAAPSPTAASPQPPTPGHGGGDSIITNSIGMKLVLIPDGEFLMGSDKADDPDAADDEQPRHPVRIARPFYLAQTEVTQGQYQAVTGQSPSYFKLAQTEVTQGKYRAVTGQSPSYFKGSDDWPVEQVSWNDAVEFCEKLNELEKGELGGARYRLPTEAEWEYACRARSTTRYSFGDDAASLAEFAWYGGGSGSKTQPVGEKRPNAWNLYDMHGNVWEWCQDWYDHKYYARSPGADPPGALQGACRVRRGGGWGSDPQGARSAFRYGGTPEYRDNGVGFRVARVQSNR